MAGENGGSRGITVQLNIPVGCVSVQQIHSQVLKDVSTHSITRSNLQLMANDLFIQIIVTLQLLVAHGKGVWEIDKVSKPSGQSLKIFVLCFVAHCPVTNKRSKSAN